MAGERKALKIEWRSWKICWMIFQQNLCVFPFEWTRAQLANKQCPWRSPFKPLFLINEKLDSALKDFLSAMITNLTWWMCKKRWLRAECLSRKRRLKKLKFLNQSLLIACENFLWDMEQYTHAAQIPDAEKVTITSMYLAGDVKLWWRTGVKDKARKLSYGMN